MSVKRIIIALITACTLLASCSPAPAQQIETLRPSTEFSKAVSPSPAMPASLQETPWVDPTDIVMDPYFMAMNLCHCPNPA